ncbi:hypothetical protein D3C81_711820 [compost metagenome]
MINKDDILNVYRYGSRVYGTATNESDHDLIIVKKGAEGIIEGIESGILNLTIYDELSFQEAINNHEISVLECLFLPKNCIITEKKKFDFELDITKLRNSISQKSSNSWVKTKKKLTVEKDYNPYIAKKSLFHSFRILKYGIQIAKYGRIFDYTEANYLWEEINSFETNDWEFFKTKYQPVYNELKSQFKLEAPKKEN